MLTDGQRPKPDPYVQVALLALVAVVACGWDRRPADLGAGERECNAQSEFCI